MMHPPFYYKVKFHFLGQDKEKNLVHHNWDKDFDNPDPLMARKEAFEAFEEFLDNLKINGKVKKNKYGNYEIVSPSGIPSTPEFDENEDIRIMSRRITESLKFREDLDVLLVLADDDLIEEFGYGDSLLHLHSVSSHGVDKEDLLDNLELTELPLYKRIGMDVEEATVTVNHYGENFYEEEEKEEASVYTILPTPFQWTTKEDYHEENEEESTSGADTDLTWDEIISRGETNTLELKSSLVFNFSENTSNYIPLFNNAKTICGFMNSNGGLLLIGISDKGTVTGIEKDLELLKSKDKIRLKVDDTIASYFGNAVASLIDVAFRKINQQEVLIIAVKPSPSPVFLKNYNPSTRKTTKHFFVRRTASTTELKDVEEIIRYIFSHPYKR